jgi:hypothetical protein
MDDDDGGVPITKGPTQHANQVKSRAQTCRYSNCKVFNKSKCLSIFGKSEDIWVFFGSLLEHRIENEKYNRKKSQIDLFI